MIAMQRHENPLGWMHDMNFLGRRMTESKNPRSRTLPQ